MTHDRQPLDYSLLDRITLEPGISGPYLRYQIAFDKRDYPKMSDGEQQLSYIVTRRKLTNDEQVRVVVGWKRRLDKLFANMTSNTLRAILARPLD